MNYTLYRLQCVKPVKDFEILVDHENLVTISCFRSSFNPTSSIFAFILNAFFCTCLCPFFSFLDINKKKVYSTKKKVGNKKKEALSIMN